MRHSYTQYGLTTLISLLIISAQLHSEECPKIQALAIGLENGLKELEILDNDLQSVGQLSLREFNYSRPFTSPIVEDRLLFGIADGVDKKGNIIYRQIASFDWKKSNQDTRLLFLPKSLMINGEHCTAEYLIQPMDMSTDSFQLGHSRIFNLTGLEATVQLGEHRTTVAAWERSVIPEVEELSGVKMARMEVSYIKDGKKQNVHHARLRYLNTRRNSLFIYPDAKNDRIAIRVVKN